MKKMFFSMAVVLSVCSFSFAANQITFSKRYSRGDDDKAYVYRTAFLTTTLNLKRTARGVETAISFSATLSTPEAQGFAESVRFGLRESRRNYGGKPVAVTSQPVVFKFQDAQIQQQAEALSSNALRTGAAVPGNVAEADGKGMGGTLPLGVLGEGTHSGTIFVQQLVGQQPSNDDTDISVRHLIKWEVTVQQGEVDVDVQNGYYYDTAAHVEIVAPAWDGTVRPHRVNLRRDEVNIDGKTYFNGRAQYGEEHPDKAETLMQVDKREFRREYNRSERRQILRQRGRR